MEKDYDEMFDEAMTVLRGIRNAICEPLGPWQDPNGGCVGNLTEGIISISQAINRHADAMNEVAEAIRDLAEATRK